MDFYTKPENARRFLSGLKSFLQSFLQLEIKKCTNLILEFYWEEIRVAYSPSNNDFFTS